MMWIRRVLSDEVLRTAWSRLRSLWKPMAWWTVLVWGGMVVVLAPLSSAFLSWRLGRADRLVIGNEELMDWVLSPVGVFYMVLVTAFVFFGGMVRYAGLFQLVSDHLGQRSTRVGGTALRLVPRLPALGRLCMVVGGAAVGVLGVLGVGLWGIYAVWLGHHDINYYLQMRPLEWRVALVAGGVWGMLVVGVTLWGVGRVALAFPAYLEGPVSIRHAFRESWMLTKGRGGRLLRLLGVAVGGWMLARVLLNGALFAVGSVVLEVVDRLTGALWPVVLCTGIYLTVSFVLNAVVGFLSFSYVSTVLTDFYYENTDLHAAAPLREKRDGEGVRMLLAMRRWLRPSRVAPVGLGVLAVSVGVSLLLLGGMPEAGKVEISAHRAGPPPSPENTLAALERSIEAGADYTEIDVQRTRDGVIVVIHDVDLMRMVGEPLRVSEMDFSEMAGLVQRPDDGSSAEERRIATLDEFMERARGRIGLMIELKYYGWDEGLAGEVVERVRALEMEGEVVLMSLNFEAVQQVRRLAPEIPVGFVSAVTVGELHRLPVDFLAVSNARLTPGLIRQAEGSGMAVHVWTVNRASRMVEVIEMGVDGIITDDPALAVRVREELGEMSPAERLLLRFRSLLPQMD